jgi:polyferredoxin
MGSIIAAIRKTRKRLIVQIAALGLLNLQFLSLRSICVPAFNCHSCPLAVFACPVGVLVNFASLRIIPIVAIGILGFAGVMVGRLWCGWVCPFGLMQDGLRRFRVKKNRVAPRLGYAKYAVLVSLVFAVPFLWPDSALTFCRVCPAGTLESAIPWAIMGASSIFRASFMVRVAILLGVLALMVAVSRSFCRWMCPLGAILSLFNRFSLFRMRMTKSDCNQCGRCVTKCPVGIDPVTEMNSPECVRCLECASTGHLKFGVK